MRSTATRLINVVAAVVIGSSIALAGTSAAHAAGTAVTTAGTVVAAASEGTDETWPW